MFAKAILLGAFAGLAVAQSAVLTFTHVPNPVTDGQAQAITYSTNDTSSAITITLKKGLSTNLQTVSTLTSSATGGQFVWTPANLPDGSDYALQISQGSQVNYFGPFTVQGASPIGYGPSSTTSATASSKISAAANVSTTTPIAPVGTAPGSGYATGTTVARNTTMSMATLTGSTSSMSSSAGNSASTTGAGFQGSSTAGAPASSPSSGSAAGFQVGGLLALACGAFAAAF